MTCKVQYGLTGLFPIPPFRIHFRSFAFARKGSQAFPRPFGHSRQPPTALYSHCLNVVSLIFSLPLASFLKYTLQHAAVHCLCSLRRVQSQSAHDHAVMSHGSEYTAATGKLEGASGQAGVKGEGASDSACPRES